MERLILKEERARDAEAGRLREAVTAWLRKELSRPPEQSRKPEKEG